MLGRIRTGLTVILALLAAGGGVCCVVSYVRPIVLRLGEQGGGNLDGGTVCGVWIGSCPADAGSQPVTWAIPGVQWTRSPVANTSGQTVLHLWAGTARQMTVSSPADSSVARFGLYYVKLSGWIVVVLLALYPFVAFLRGPWRRHRRRRRGHCARCGYDLHGNLSGVCPECGSPAAAQKKRARTSPSVPSG